MGVKDSTASLLFLSQGFLLGIMGGLLGVALGLLLALSFTFFALNLDGTPVVALNISYPFIIFSALVAVLSATLAALVPAGKSSRLPPWRSSEMANIIDLKGVSKIYGINVKNPSALRCGPGL
jgi:lipoprotein-releasing system permease protein